MALQLETSLGEIEWIPRPRLTQLHRLEIETVEDLLRHYPRRHEDRTEFAGFPREESEQPICLCGEVVKTQIKRFGGWKKIFEVTLEEADSHALSQPLILRWFNVHYVQKMIVNGQRLVVFGKPRLRGKRICMEHPEFEIIFVSSDKSRFNWETYIRETKMPWLAIDYDQLAGFDSLRQLGGNSIPSLLVLDESGHLVASSYEGDKYIGPQNSLAALDKIFAQKAATPLAQAR